MHVDRREARLWHAAADACIAGLLDQAGLAHALAGPAALELPPCWSAEEYYAMLGRLAGPSAEPDEEATDSDGSCGSGCVGLPRGYELPAGVDHQQVGHAEAERLRRTVAIEYRGHCRTRGTEPGGVGRWAQAVLESTTPWQQVLAAAVRRSVAAVSGTADYSFARPSRRRVAGVVLPAMRRPLPAVAVVLDTSGSIDDGLLAQALGEVEGTLRGLGVAGARVRVLACDAAVYEVSTVSQAREVQLAGGGGTDMRVGIAEALRLRPGPEVVVVLTDGYTPWPLEPPPGVAVVAGLLGRDRATLPETPPWMVRVECVGAE
jgi:hypothetical protein